MIVRGRGAADGAAVTVTSSTPFNACSFRTEMSPSLTIGTASLATSMPPMKNVTLDPGATVGTAPSTTRSELGRTAGVRTVCDAPPGTRFVELVSNWTYLPSNSYRRARARLWS